MPAAHEHHAVIDLTQSDDDSQQSPSQLPGQPRGLISQQGTASRLSRGTDHQQQLHLGQPKRRRLVQGGCARQEQQQQQQQQQQGSSTAFDFELEDDEDLPQGAVAEETEGLGCVAAGRGQSQVAKSSGVRGHQHRERTEKDSGKRGRAAEPVKDGLKDWRAGGNSRGRCKPSTRRDVSSSPEWAASSDSEEEEENDDDEEEDEKEEVTKRGRKRGQSRAKEAPLPASKRGRGAAATKGDGGSPPAKGPLQLTLSQCHRPLSQLLGASLGKQPPSSQQRTSGCVLEGHAHAGAKDNHRLAASPSRQTQLPMSSSQHQQLPLSQRSGPPPSPARPPLQLTRTLQQQQQQQQQQQAQGSEHPGRALPMTVSSSSSRAKASKPAATAKAAKKLPPCPSSAAAGCEGGGALWYDKYAPADTSALAVHRKKVEEVRDFLQRQEQPGYRHWGGRMLIASGPVGCGKSTTVRLLASELGYHVVEYNPPTPTLWLELQQQDDPGPLRSLGPSYVSKLDDFEAFVNRAKYPALPLASRSSTAAQGTPTPPSSSSATQYHHHQQQQQQQQTSQAAGPHKKLLLIDDLPHVHDAERSRRLAACLADLAATARGPVVLICTQTSGSSSGGKEGGGNMATGGVKGLNKDVMSALDSAGATLLNFNPITANSIIKVLQQVAAAEGCPLSPDAAASIAGLADGDIRNALQTMQAMFAGHRAVQAQQGGTKRGRGKGAGGKGSKATKVGSVGGGLVGNEAARIASTQRDLGLDIFHALGKFLYNKRECTDETAAEQQQQQQQQQMGSTAGGSSKRGLSKAAEAAAAAVAEVRKQAEEQAPSRAPWMPCLESMEDRLCPSLRRPPTKYDPEAIVTQSGLDPIQVAAFLHENYLNFIAEEAIEDVSSAASYMSDAAFMASRNGASSSDFSGGFWGLEEPSTATNLAAACGGSVAARGLMFANTHPAPRRWTPLQAPAQTRVERACHDNAERVQGTSACLAFWHGTLAAGGCSAAVSAQVMPWLRTLAYFPDYSTLSRVMPSSWCVFTIASSQNTVLHTHGPSSWGSSRASLGPRGQLQQLDWVQDQHAGQVLGSGLAEEVDAVEEDPIDS